MRNAIILALFAFLALSVPREIHAADVSAVLGACDRTQGCGYSSGKNGDISGCSKNACFYCPADGSRQCFAVSARGKGKSRPGGVDIGGVKVEPRKGSASTQSGKSPTSNGNVSRTSSSTSNSMSNSKTLQQRSSEGRSQRR
jgi:hypothetical protein